ncbi:hypothetical protein SFC66_04200 [Terribacillus saccharophilus]|uniref:hypothetical protein n=1 Tax=Terribacillus saccharophilus TaxID=361277 RepID=UPI003982AB97
MINDFKHLSQGLTVIFCNNTLLKSIEEVYVDTTLFNYISAFNVEWKIWVDKKGNNVSGKRDRVVGGVDLDNDRRIVFLKRLIGEYLHGQDYSYSLLNGDYFDLRNDNIYKFKNGTGHSSQVRAEKKELLQLLPSLAKMVDTDIMASNIDVKIVEYHNQLLVIEDNTVVKELTSDQATALSNYFNTLK